MASMVTKKTRGRQKTQMKKIDKKTALHISCSKRRGGLFKKSGELGILCGAEVAVVTFSPGGKAFTYGNPTADLVINRFLAMTNPNEHQRSITRSDVNEKRREYLEALDKLEVEKGKREKKLKEEAEKESSGERGYWWEEARVEDMELEELEQYKASLQELRNNVSVRVNDLLMMEKPIAAATADLLVAENLWPVKANHFGG